jgi:beta-1,4-mannooligosaccharide/beta-1,4-mannosyl-N-acetylglucosamine phosphorylase
MRRYSKNPILTRLDIPEIQPHLLDVSSVFNPGAIKFGDKYLLLLRVQNRGRETFTLVAQSSNGFDFNITDEIVHFQGIESIKEPIYHIYDPRITLLEGTYYIMVAMDMDSGCQLGLVKTLDFKKFEFLGIVSNQDIRNGVLFPERVQGKFLRMDRPNTIELEGGPTSGNAIFLSESEDLLDWRPVQLVIKGRFHYWDERIGSGPPPVKTREGWLHVYHGIAEHFGSASIYQAGVILLDLNDPGKVIARSKYNILEPREMYELVGQVPNVVFPSGMIVDDYDQEGFALPDSRVLIYYGAADTVVGVATSTIAELIRLAYTGN